MELIHKRMQREIRTVEAMIRLYCKKRHGRKSSLCESCNTLLEYARYRLNRCPFQEFKATCGKCRIHCYKPDMRKQIRRVMRFAGPHMSYRHPVMSIMHFFDGLRKQPDIKKIKARRARNKT